MSAGRRIGLTLALWAVVEIVVFALLQRAVGVAPLLILSVVTAVAGVLAVRRAGNRAWSSLRRAAEEQTQPASLSDAGLVLAGGLLLIVPGVLSDLLGVLCLIPATRPLVRIAGRAAFPSIARYQDSAGLLRAKMEPDTVVEGSVADPAEPTKEPEFRVIEGEIEP